MQCKATHNDTYENTHTHKHHIGCFAAWCRVANLLGGGLGLEFLAHNLNDVAGVQLGAVEYGDVYSHTHNLLYAHAMHKWLCAQLAHTLAVKTHSALAAVCSYPCSYYHYGELQYGIVVHLAANPFLLAYGIFTSAAEYHLVTYAQHLARAYAVDDFPILSYALHKKTFILLLEEPLQLLHTAPIDKPLVRHLVGTELHEAFGGYEPGLFAVVTAKALFQFAASGAHLVETAQQARP